MEPTYEKILQAIGRNIRKIREEQGITQSELARIADIHRNQIMRIEKGSPPANIKLFIAISEGLEIPLSDLFRIEE